MKIFITSILLSLIFTVPVLADSDHSSSVEEVLAQIAPKQQVINTEDIKCEAVSDEQFEELGEAVMSIMHPSIEEHELMDKMMGGEGSETLQAMHINMGQKYLNCGGNFGMMESGMMGSGTLYGRSQNMFSPKGGMMNFSFSSLHHITLFLFWIALILIIASAIKYLVIKK